MNTHAIRDRALLDQADAVIRDAFSRWPTIELLLNVDALVKAPERIIEQWEFAAQCVMRVLLEEVQRRDEEGQL